MTTGAYGGATHRLSSLLAMSADPYLVATSLLQQLLPVAEEICTLFDDRLADLEAVARRQGESLDEKTTGTFQSLWDDSATFVEFLYEVEFGRLFSEEAREAYGPPGVPLLAFVLVKIALEIDWRRAAL